MAATGDAELREILQFDRVAVVGCSRDPEKDAHRIPKYLLEQGYVIVPVNPYAEEVFGRDTYDTLTDVPGRVDIVEVFRPSEEVAGIVDTAIGRDDVDVVWTQLGIRDDAAAERAAAAGLRVVQDRCMMVEHRRLFG
ncbi:MAG: CoA-binding protein [Halobacteriales archaeon]